MTKQNHQQQQHSLLAVNNNDLLNRIIKLPDEEFWKLVSVRLNIPLLSTNQQIEEGKIPDVKDRQFWTEEYLIDQLFFLYTHICHYPSFVDS